MSDMAAYKLIATRTFVESDRAALCEIYLASRRHAFTWLDTTRFSHEDFDRDTVDEDIRVATCSGLIAGFVSFWRPENFIHNLFVHPALLRCGLGTALLNEALSQLDRPAALKCLSRNHEAIKFYRSQGWQDTGNGIGPDGDYLLMHYTAMS